MGIMKLRLMPVMIQSNLDGLVVSYQVEDDIDREDNGGQSVVRLERINFE